MSASSSVVGRDSSVGTATRYGLHGPESNPAGGRDSAHSSRPTLGPTQPPAEWVPGLFPWDKGPRRGLNQSPPPSAEVKERVKLYLCSPSGPSEPVLGRILHLPLPLLRRELCIQRRQRYGRLNCLNTVREVPWNVGDHIKGKSPFLFDKPCFYT